MTLLICSRLQSAERPAACGENQPIDLRGGAAAKALGKGGVFGVDGDDLIWPCGSGDQRAADHQRLLVGQRKDPSRPQCGQRRSQPGRAGDPIQNDVARHCRQIRGRIWACEDARQRDLSLRPTPSAGLGVESQLQILDGRGAADRNRSRPGVQRLPGEQRNLRPPAARPTTRN